MNVAISGSTGFIGSFVMKRLASEGFTVIPLLRDDFRDIESIKNRINGVSVIVHLAGEPIGGRWVKSKRKRIYDSRILTTRMLVRAIMDLNQPVYVLSASGIGVYDTLNVHSDESNCYENDFLSKVVQDWENEWTPLVNSNASLAVLRLGVVLSEYGGFMKTINNVFRMKLVFLPDNRTVYFSYIHLETLLGIISLFIENRYSGIFNCVEETPVNYESFYNYMRLKFKPLFIVFIPKFIVKAILGGTSSLLFKGQRVKPYRLMSHGYLFTRPSF